MRRRRKQSFWSSSQHLALRLLYQSQEPPERPWAVDFISGFGHQQTLRLVKQRPSFLGRKQNQIKSHTGCCRLCWRGEWRRRRSGRGLRGAPAVLTPLIAFQIGGFERRQLIVSPAPHLPPRQPSSVSNPIRRMRCCLIRIY